MTLGLIEENNINFVFH